MRRADPTKSLVVGASAGIGRALAEILARRGHAVGLVASDDADLAPLDSDLQLRFGVPVSRFAMSLSPKNVENLCQRVHQELGRIDNLFLVCGVLHADKDFRSLSPELLQELIDVNLAVPLHLARLFLPDLLASPTANCVGIGSIAAARGRSKNTVYGAAKRGLEFFFAGLRQAVAGTRCHTQFYRVGYVATQMTFGKRSLLPQATPAYIAEHILKNLGRDVRTAYLPWWWRGPIWAYQAIPDIIFQRGVSTAQGVSSMRPSQSKR